jgi:hypothetical protein
MIDMRRMIDRLWLEFRVTKQCSHITDGCRAIESYEVPNWFFSRELGFGIEHAPSILENYRRRAMLARYSKKPLPLVKKVRNRRVK